jgi:glycosyltransferase involved in cell wall biosynthesis
MRLHLLGLPHTVTTDAFSHCAFTGKVQKMSPMMRPLGYDVVHYGVAGAESGATVQVDLMTQAEQHALLGHDHSDPTQFYGNDANVGAAVFIEFNRRLRETLNATVQPGEIVLLPFGHGHGAAIDGHKGINIESGIGYPQTFLPLRIYESLAWMHRDQGKCGREGNNYEWVIPNYFVAEDWPVVTTPDDYILFFGRIGDTKGLPTVVELAKQFPDRQFIICGQGDPSPYLTQPNIQYQPPLAGRARASLLGNASLVLMPSNFVEPFAGVAIEAMLCGTPVAAVTYGAFTETIQQGVNGWRCRTLEEWKRAVTLAPTLDRAAIGASARGKYSLEAVGPMYDTVFQQVHGLATGRDWYTFPSTF